MIFFRSIAKYRILSAMASLGLASVAAAAEKAPNIILVLADDLGYGDLSCYGQDKYKTPSLDRMAREGVLFTDFYVTSPACSPSRASVLTGRYPDEVGVPRVLSPRSLTGLITSATLVSSVLKSKGYTTAAIGKWHVGHLPQFMPLQRGFDSYYGIPYSNDMKPAPVFRDNKLVQAEADQSALTAQYTKEAVRIIDEHAGKDKPFFIYLAHTFPHVPLHVSSEFKGKSGAGLYGDVVTELDWSVGEIMKTLKKNKQAENTLVVFTSDNGPWTIKKDQGGSTGGLRGSKGTDYEGGVRVPFIAWWPGKVPSGHVVATPAITLDLLPTFAALAGADVSNLPLRGRNILGLMTQRDLKQEPDRSLYFADYYVQNPVGSVRHAHYKAVFGREAQGKQAARPTELFDLITDPRETNNRAADRPGILQKLTDEANRVRAEFRASNPWGEAADGRSTDALKYVTPDK